MAETVNEPTTRRDRAARLLLFLTWLAATVWMSWHHAVWRDEVRALSCAIESTSIRGFLETVHREPHPMLWFILLRLVHALVPSPFALKIAAVSVAAGAAFVLAWRAPFGMLTLNLILFGKGLFFEYSVMARNYGISVLLLFLLAALYRAGRMRGILPGCLLFLLANCNAFSVLLVGCFLLMWFVDRLGQTGDTREPLRSFILNAALAGAGIVTAFASTYPPFFTPPFLATNPITKGATSLQRGILAVALPSGSGPFDELLPPVGRLAEASGPRKSIAPLLVAGVATSIVLYGSLLGLLRWPGAFAAALAGLLSFSGFFSIVQPGHYRHEGLWLAFLIACYWAHSGRPSMPFPRPFARFTPPPGLCRVGTWLFTALLALQIPAAAQNLYRTLTGQPFSRSQQTAALLAGNPETRDAILIADPDYLLESLPYYSPNRTYLMREERFGDIVTFHRTAREVLSLDDILGDARMLHARYGRPVAILLAQDLDESQAPAVYTESYFWKLSVTPDQVHRFRKATSLLAHFDPVPSEEFYSVYLFRGSGGDSR